MNKKYFFVAASSSFVQYYDYHLFGFLAAIIAKNFIPHSNNVIALLHAYFIILIGMIAKPIGSLLLGKIGDLKGRSNIFTLSLIGTAAASLIIGVTPTYNQIGVISAFIILIARMCICAFVSSGTDGARIFIYEHMSKNMQCLGVGMTAVFTQGGSFVASISSMLFCLDFLPSYSWRGAFILGSLMGIIVLILKKKLNVRDEINIQKEAHFNQFESLSIFKIIRSNLKLFLLSAALAGAIGSTTQFIILFFGTYNFEILQNIPQPEMQFYTSVSIIIYMIFSLIGGFIADKFNKLNVARFSSIIILIISLGQIIIMRNNNISIILFLLTNIALPFLTMPSAVILKSSIPIVIRYRIFNLAHATGSIVISAPTSFIATLIYYKTGITWLPIFYFITTILIIFTSLNLLSNQFVKKEF